MPEESQQATFGDDGEMQVGDESDDTDSDQIMRDDGQELDEYETCGGFNRYEIASLFQKAVRRSDKEKAMFAAFELCRSGYGWNFWDRAQTIMVEDLLIPLEESQVPAAIYNLMQLSKNKWSMDEGMGVAAAMRAAAILAEAESSHELLVTKNFWKRIAEDRLEAYENGEEPEHDFPIPPDSEEFGDLGYQVLDMHTYTGKKYGRNPAHFMIESSRTSEMSDIAAKYKRLMMETAPFPYTDEQIENGLEPTGRGEDQWDGNHVGFPTEETDE